MDLTGARRLLAMLGVPDLEAELAAGWQSMETGPSWALEQDLVKMPPRRCEFPDEDALARYLVLRHLISLKHLPVPVTPAPARPWEIVTAKASSGPGLRWSTRLITGSSFVATDEHTLLVRDVSSWWDHQLSGAVIIRTIDLATGRQLGALPDNAPFALGLGPERHHPLPRWARGVVPEARSSDPRQDLAVLVRPAPPPTGASESRYVAVRHDDARHAAAGIRLEIWGAGSGR